MDAYAPTAPYMRIILNMQQKLAVVVLLKTHCPAKKKKEKRKEKNIAVAAAASRLYAIKVMELPNIIDESKLYKHIHLEDRDWLEIILLHIPVFFSHVRELTDLFVSFRKLMLECGTSGLDFSVQDGEISLLVCTIRSMAVSIGSFESYILKFLEMQ